MDVSLSCRLVPEVVGTDRLARPRSAEDAAADPAPGARGEIAGCRVSDRGIPAQPTWSMADAVGGVPGRHAVDPDVRIEQHDVRAARRG